jgi:bacteriorhodopsin
MILYTTGLSLSDILTTAFFAWVTVVMGLAGALTSTRYKWGFFVMGVAALMYIWCVDLTTQVSDFCFLFFFSLSLFRSVLVFHSPRTTFNAGPGVRSGFVRGAWFVTFITMLYPVAWGLSEGGNVISPTREMIFYGILDLLLGPVFLYYFVSSLRRVDYGMFGLRSGKYTDGAHGTGFGTYGNAGAGGVPGAGPHVGANPNGVTGAGPHVGANHTGAATGTGVGPGAHKVENNNAVV